MAMRSKLIAGLLVTCGWLAGAQTLVAHHAGTMFDEDKTTELTGTIKEFQFTNPHSWIQVVGATKPGEAPKEWSIEWGSPNQLSRQGIRPSTFKAGAKVTMRVHPMRDGSAAGNFVAAKFDDGKTVGRWE
jgi:hypothetical protein